MTNTLWVPGSETEAETFLWHTPQPRLNFGLAYLHRQEALRVLGTYEVVPSYRGLPNLRLGFGVQGIGTGNPGYFATTEREVRTPSGALASFAGIGFRANESHSHGLLGLRFSPNGPWSFGAQLDGHGRHLFVTHDASATTFGVYLVDMKSFGLLVGTNW